MRLAGKVAWITGGGAGIGKAVSIRFAKEGANVVVLELDERRGEAVVESIRGAGGEAALAVGSATDETDVNRALDVALEEFGGLDILVNNAYYCHGTHVPDIDPELWDRNIEGCLKSAYLCSRAALPRMIRRGGGSIVNISSVNALMSFGEAAYSAAKAGVISLTKTTAVDYGPDGVRVNAICPGTVITEGWQHVLEKDPRIIRTNRRGLSPQTRGQTRGDRERCALSGLGRGVIRYRLGCRGRRGRDVWQSHVSGPRGRQTLVSAIAPFARRISLSNQDLADLMARCAEGGGDTNAAGRGDA